jgi:pimeloyl-ACP methyl ester carboxylesterase
MNKNAFEMKSLGKLHSLRTGTVWASVSGNGEPVVVVLSGAGTVAMDYYMIQNMLANDVTAIIYDRLGIGYSSFCNLPRTSRQVVEELKELLDAINVSPPFILVGHSLGGMYARHFARLYPGSVSGMVLLDPAHEDYDLFMPAALNRRRKVPSAKEKERQLMRQKPREAPSMLVRVARNHIGKWILERIPMIAKYRETYKRLFAEEMKGWPVEIANQLVHAHVDVEWGLSGIQEASNAYAVFEEVRKTGPIPDVSTIILCSMRIDGFKKMVLRGESEEEIAGEIAAKKKLYEYYLSSLSYGRLVEVEAGHVTLPFRHPEMVQAAVRELIARMTI